MFTDIEGAFNNLSFSAIKQATQEKIPNKPLTKWYMNMLDNRKITLEGKKWIQPMQGTPRSAIILPTAWILVMNRAKLPPSVPQF